MVRVDAVNRTVYLNAATVPRVKRHSKGMSGTPGLHRHHFMLVTLEAGEVESAKDVWVEVRPPPTPLTSNSQAAEATMATPAAALTGAEVTAAAAAASGALSGGAVSSRAAFAAMTAAGWVTHVVEEVPVLRTVHGANGVVKFYYNHHDKASLKLHVHVLQMLLAALLPLF